MNKNSKLSTSEIVFLVISSVLCAIGLTMVIFHFIGHYALPDAGVKASKNWVYISEQAAFKSWSGMGWLGWGIIIIFLGVIIYAISASKHAKKYDVDTDKETRKRQRLNSINFNDVVPAVKVVEKPAAEEPKTEANK